MTSPVSNDGVTIPNVETVVNPDGSTTVIGYPSSGTSPGAAGDDGSGLGIGIGIGLGDGGGDGSGEGV
ncbi:hypothetical protein [Streptomyces sp. NPDC050145]|uniref:hypothetical protein n=1 Tax=Streptomyces sp. NPDC050145 TaxID=3365602 RepID=UPI003797F0DA